MITPPDASARTAAYQRQQILTKPTGALGRLEDVSAWVCAVQGQCPPVPFARPALVVFAGDHGVARTAGTSAYPPEVTAQMVANLATGGAAANVLARQMNASVRVVDVSVDADPSYMDAIDAGVVAHRVRRSSGSIDREDAMTLADCRAAIAVGAALADGVIEAGADIVISGDMGIGNTTSSSVLIAVLTGSSAQRVTGRGTGIDDDGLERKRAVVAAAMLRADADPVELLVRVGAPDIAAMVGFLLRAPERGIPVVLDGIVSCAAALVARAIEPEASAWWVAGHRSTEPAASVALVALDLEPVLNLDLRLGEGTGALLALPLINAAALTLAEMATFDSAGVTDRSADA